MSNTYSTRLLHSAAILRAAAVYVERHGYYLPIDRVMGSDPNFDWESFDGVDEFDLSSSTPLTPAASERGAIAMVVYGWPNDRPVNDLGPAYEAYSDALGALSLLYAPHGEGYGCWVFPYELAAALRAAANDCEQQAEQQRRHEQAD
jgi:hypothetical protein